MKTALSFLLFFSLCLGALGPSRAAADDLADIAELDTHERGLALIGYLIWKESPEYDENNFIDWIKAKCHFHGIEWE